jgi:hypothetical protein
VRVQRQDVVALALFAVVAAGGLWLWTGEGPAIWIADFAIMCGF